jgi:hypothetical protein
MNKDGQDRKDAVSIVRPSVNIHDQCAHTLQNLVRCPFVNSNE